MKRVGLRAKFILLILAVLIIIFSIISVVLIRFTTDNLRRDLTNQSKAFASLATEPIGNAYVLYKDSGRIRILQQIEKFTDLDKHISNVQVVDNSGKVLFAQRDGASASLSSSQATSFEPIFENKNGTISRIISPYLEEFGGHRYSVVYDISAQSIDDAISRETIYIAVLTVFALLVTAFLFYLAINRYFLQPMQKLSTTALLVSKGDLDKEIKVDRNDEISDLAKSVNTMADSLKADISKLKDVDKLKTEFMMIASHNLRTPLTIIQGYLDTIKQLKLDAEVSKLIDVITANSERLHILAEDILTISQIEANEKLSLDPQPVDLTALARSIGNEFTVLAKEKGVIFNQDLPERSVNIKGASAHIRSAVWNLLDNALKFNRKGGQVSLTLITDSDSASITVKDTGIGIAAEEISKLFTKFHRGTSTLNYDYEGVGIGLYISQLIIKQHGGLITANSTLGEGSTFVIKLPLTSAQASVSEPSSPSTGTSS